MSFSRNYRTGSQNAGATFGRSSASSRRLKALGVSASKRKALVSLSRGPGKGPQYGVGYGKRRKTYKRLKVAPLLRRAIKKIENEDKEMKYTSVARHYADIAANTTGSWTRIVANQPILRDVTDTVVLAQSNIAMYGTSAYNQVVVGDSIILNREGSEIYSKRLDLFFDCVFDGNASAIKVPHAMVRVWVVQAKHLASSTTPTFQLWQGESKSGEISQAWTGKSTQWFDPRSASSSSQKNQFKVLKKMLIKVKNPYAQALNHVYGNTAQVANGIAVPAGTAVNPTGGPYTTGAAITTIPAFPDAAGAKQFFRSVYLGKNCLSTKFDGDASGSPSMGNVFVLAQAWSPFLNTYDNITMSLYGRMCYKEDPGC